MNNLNKNIEEILHFQSIEKYRVSQIKLEELKRAFNLEAIRYYQSLNSKFLVDSSNKDFFQLLCKYFAKDPSFESAHKGSLKKGLLISGNNGTGKSSSLKIIQNISKKYNLRQLWFPIISTREVVHKFNTEKNKDFVIKNYSQGNYSFDDLGAENVANNIFVFGKDEIFTTILESRYNQFINKGTITHITTNLTMEEIKIRYGSRVEDRFVEMFNFFNIPGKSKRDLTY